MLQLREKEIFETLKKMNKFKFVIIGGYAINAYTLPRFSVDCDIVVKDEEELKEIEEVLVNFGYVKEENNKDKTSYYGDFLRLEKDLGDNIKVRIINLDALFVLKFVSCRLTDIRDIFMLAPNINNKEWIKEEISKKYDFNKLFLKVEEKITSKQFKDSLQGVYGIIDNKVLEKHKKAILSLAK